MGKFSGLLLCSDLDDTLLTTDKKISPENKAALGYFMAEDGHFAFATGRVPRGARLALDYIVPNSPVVCFNGAGIYDFCENKLLWERTLDDDAARVIELVEEKMPQAGVEVCTNDKVYFCRTNRIVQHHQQIEKFPDNTCEHTDVKEPWKKVIFMTESEEIAELRQIIAQSEYAEKYSFVQSSPNYYELLPKGATKGDAMIELAKLLGIDPKRTIGVGDNENDIAMVKMAGIGVAVRNAAPAVLDAADYITVDNNHSALAAVIECIENGKMQF